MKEITVKISDGYKIKSIIKCDENSVLVSYEADKPQLPKSWEEFCEMFPTVKAVEYFVGANSGIIEGGVGRRRTKYDKNLLPNRAMAEAIRALCQLIQLRDCYNGDWVPDWKDTHTNKFVISLVQGVIYPFVSTDTREFLYFKTDALCQEFLRCFRPLIEKLKPLYGIKKEDEEC